MKTSVQAVSAILLGVLLMALAACSVHSSITVVTATRADETAPQADISSDDVTLVYGVLQQSIPAICDEDMQTFNPGRALDYILAHGAGHEYYISDVKAEDGVLRLTLIDQRYTKDINDEYQYLKTQFSLKDAEVLSLSVFSGCVIHEGILYRSAEAWQERRQFTSYEEWISSTEDEDSNSVYFGEITLEPLPVMGDAKIYLLGEDDEWTELFEFTTQQFIARWNEETPFCSEFIFSYSDGHITEVTEVFEP